MRLVEQAEQDLALKNHSVFKAYADIELFSLEYDQSLAIKAPFTTNGSIPDQLPYLDRNVIDNRQFEGQSLGRSIFPHVSTRHGGNELFVQAESYGLSHVGYIGSLPNESGRIDDTLAIRFSPRLLKSLKLHFAEGRYPTQFTLTVYGRYDKILWTHEVADNNDTNLEYQVDIEQLAYSISISNMQMVSSKRIWLLSFTPSLTLNLDPFDIANFKLEEKPASNSDYGFGGAYVKSLTLKIFNMKRYFDYANGASPYYGALGSNAKIALTLQHGLVSYLMGTFYSTDFTSTPDSACVTIKATCYLAHNKNYELTSRIYPKTTAYEAFYDLSRLLGFSNSLIDSSLKNLTLSNYALSNTLGNTLNELCAMSGTICLMNYNNNGFMVWALGSLTNVMRNPLRLFKANAIGTLTQDNSPVPNLLEVEYGFYQFDGDDEIIKKKTYGFTNEKGVNTDEALGYTVFPIEWHLKPYDRPIGGYTEPTIVIIFSRDELGDELYNRIEKADVTDNGFEYEVLEYSYERNEDNNAITFSLWNFKADREEEDILSICLIGRPLAKNKEVGSESVVVPMRPNNYVAPDLTADTVLGRNGQNEPFEYSFKIDDKVQLSAIKAGNYNEKGKFEFTIETASSGAKVRIWNYLLMEQTFALTFFGQKIVESQSRVKRILRNEEAIALNGQISQTITLATAAGEQAAEWMLLAVKNYYRILKGKATLTPWRDVRLTVADRIAIESARGYRYQEALIDTISTEFDGSLKQKLTLKTVNPEGRDSRCYGSLIFDDRPEVWLKQIDLTGGSV